MRETIGTTWTIQLMIIFILIFACFLSLVLSYSKAYTIKNESLSIIEKYEGVRENSAEIINNFLKENSYRTKGKCPDGWMGAENLEGAYQLASSGEQYYYCFQEVPSQKGSIYYNIRFFYKFNLPIIGDITTFRIDGTTATFIGSNDRIKG